MEGWRDGLTGGGVALHSEACKQSCLQQEAGAGGPGGAGGRRREIEEECRPLDVHPTDKAVRNFFLTKLTTPCVGFDLLAHISASKMWHVFNPFFQNLQSN